MANKIKKPVTKAEADKNFKMVMEILKKEKEEYEFQKTVKKVYSKPKVDYNKLSRSVKKAAHQSPGGLDLHKDENRYYSSGETQRWMEGTSYFENYQAMKNQDSYE
tara:strand:+ start:978 stop:1295 length:318 start_codon:yes stop_codon:yes gene_type:complete